MIEFTGLHTARSGSKYKKRKKLFKTHKLCVTLKKEEKNCYKSLVHFFVTHLWLNRDVDGTQKKLQTE